MASTSLENRKMGETQAQINEIVNIMQINIEKVRERDHKLPDLENRSQILLEGGKEFEQQSQKLKRKYWLKNVKMTIILTIIVVFLLIIITVATIIVLKRMGSDNIETPSTHKNLL